MPNTNRSPKNWRNSREFKSVRAELFAALGGKENLDAITASRVNEYLDFWVLRNQLQDDITARGLYVADDRNRIAENRSVSLSIQASRQMSAISAALGLVIGVERQMEGDAL